MTLFVAVCRICLAFCRVSTSLSSSMASDEISRLLNEYPTLTLTPDGQKVVQQTLFLFRLVMQSWPTNSLYDSYVCDSTDLPTLDFLWCTVLLYVVFKIQVGWGRMLGDKLRTAIYVYYKCHWHNVEHTQIRLHIQNTIKYRNVYKNTEILKTISVGVLVHHSVDKITLTDVRWDVGNCLLYNC